MDDLIKQKTEVSIGYPKEEAVLNIPNDVRTITGMFKTTSTVPTKTPRSIYEQIQIYVNGADTRLYFYDTVSNTWIGLTNTTVSRNGSSALTGDVKFASGGGMTILQSGQTITLSVP